MTKQQQNAKKELVGIVQSIMTIRKCTLSNAIDYLSHDLQCTSEKIRRCLVGTKFDNSQSQQNVVAILSGEEILSSNFDYLSGASFCKLIKNIISQTKCTIPEAVIEIFNYLKIPITDSTLEVAGNIIRSKGKLYFTATTWNVGFAPYLRRIERAEHHGIDVKKIVGDNYISLSRGN